MLKKHPWIFLVIIFLMPVAAWTIFIRIAQDYSPERIEVEHADTTEAPTPQE